ncbi:alkyl hydroperoxide reductase subunit F [Pseudomonas chlororaphis]|uniref:alkyl hydroperoxide reductase subunit F n=1 Tax=Pseudomonas chlororaphis TaxID=587753 RepID=UPI0007B3BB30|nr:alkyl hydroperoxide reductase subunit F [Pseudomonas chlororaphis]AZC51104.1 Alkyl hydroperoxide reductase protein F [Pseudomonas chlororaphis subsp. piscium]AZC57682.1 Alkyl hydroperoxide reductase protein F [Pseudomonas chlororaphis subsp. piscium]AZC63894.1 Alkyl hydroperoxide reductase protein F [Pseudomonas chlororaphis subsp. piscium]AZC76397.1 Alkyl hydroperoxide reductase protein F [Pseudomonas chlororaphis subsp. piscium]AZC82609.1 Alkyl hydroperoxide reductase protein F [Pseudomon
MLDANLKAQLKSYLERVTQPIEIVASLDDGAKSQEMLELLKDVASLSSQITLLDNGSDGRKPSFSINRPGADISLRFAGIPMGHEFTSLVLALLQVGGHPSKASVEVIEQIRALKGEFNFETYFSLSCQNCPDVVQALNLMAVLNPNIRHVAIDGALFQDEVNDRKIMAVPSVYLNGVNFGQGRMGLEEILGKLDTGAIEKQAEKISAKDAFDVLVVGGGPAGASAAIYAARKGIRTGVAAERFGGQVLDTMAIENFISVQETEGPKLASALEEHVRQYDVDIMNLQRASALVPAKEVGGLHEVRFESGASLKAKSLILATGARWREMGVPGEQEYKAKGVCFCPHCDGPLFKGKRVAVIGGGNSGVEAAIDLAGIVSHVTLLEFDSKLRADAVLQRKLYSLPNVNVITSALTSEVKGDGQKVTGLVYKDRDSGEFNTVDLEGIFVQIGLLPNTDWLKGSVELSPRGEIIVDARGETSLPGVFAAGDVTTVPYKQIVIAVGEGAKASLSAFDHLIRTSAPA